jgi:hypothetical protein
VNERLDLEELQVAGPKKRRFRPPLSIRLSTFSAKLCAGSSALLQSFRARLHLLLGPFMKPPQFQMPEDCGIDECIRLSQAMKHPPMRDLCIAIKSLSGSASLHFYLSYYLPSLSISHSVSTHIQLEISFGQFAYYPPDLPEDYEPHGFSLRKGWKSLRGLTIQDLMVEVEDLIRLGARARI